MHTKLKRRRPSYLLHGVRDPSSFVRTVLRLFARCRAFARSFGLSCGVAFERGVGKEMERMLGGGAVRAATSLPMHTASSGTVRAGCHRAWQGGDGIIRLALRILARSSKYVSLGCMQGRPQRRVLLIFLRSMDVQGLQFQTHVSLCPGDAGL
jgi:hypothetical protein